MKNYTFAFEIQTLLQNFCGAFNDIVIKRYDKDNVLQSPASGFNVSYIYAPKQRVYDTLKSPAPGGISLPVVAVNISSISRDNSRVFNKIDGFNVPGKSGNDYSFTQKIPSPVPINIGVNMSIITKYQSDMDQIISNFVPYCDPYVVISWLMPISGTNTHWELRSEVLWDNNIRLSYPIDLAGNQPFRITADTSFVIKGWLFKANEGPTKRIYVINSDFNVVPSIDQYSDVDLLDMEDIFQGQSSIPPGTECFVLSGAGAVSAFNTYVSAYSSTEIPLSVYNLLSAGNIASPTHFMWSLSGA